MTSVLLHPENEAFLQGLTDELVDRREVELNIKKGLYDQLSCLVVDVGYILTILFCLFEIFFVVIAWMGVLKPPLRLETILYVLMALFFSLAAPFFAWLMMLVIWNFVQFIWFYHGWHKVPVAYDRLVQKRQMIEGKVTSISTEDQFTCIHYVFDLDPANEKYGHHSGVYRALDTTLRRGDAVTILYDDLTIYTLAILV